MPGRICLLPDHPRRAERRRLADLAEPDGEGFNPAAAGREVKQPVLRQVDDNPLTWRLGQDVQGGYDQPAPHSRHKLIDPGVYRGQRSVPETEFARDIVEPFARLNHILAHLADDLLLRRQRKFLDRPGRPLGRLQ